MSSCAQLWVLVGQTEVRRQVAVDLGEATALHTGVNFLRFHEP